MSDSGWDSDEEETTESSLQDKQIQHPWLLIAIDCSEKMFQCDENKDTYFQVALKSAHQLYKEVLLHKFNKVAITFYHSDKNIRSMFTFKTDFVKSIQLLKELCALPIAELKKKFIFDVKVNDYKFSHFLVDSINLYTTKDAKEFKKMLIVTVNDDPTFGITEQKSHIIRELQHMKEMNIDFSFMTLSADFKFELFYEEAFQCIKKPLPKYYFNLETLPESIIDFAKHDKSCRKLKFFLDQEYEEFILMLREPITKKHKLLPNQLVGRTTHKAVHRAITDSSTTYCLEFCQNLIPLVNGKEDVLKMKGSDKYKVGITLLHATKEKISTKGLNMQTPFLLKAYSFEFQQLWSACKQLNYYLLCILKFRINGVVHLAELTPVLIGNEKCFKVLVPSNLLECSTEEPVLKNDEKKPLHKLESLIGELVEAMTIANLEFKAYYPLDYTNKVNYCKKEIMEDTTVEDAVAEPLDFLNKNYFKNENLVQKLQDKFVKTFPEYALKGVKRKK